MRQSSNSPGTRRARAGRGRKAGARKQARAAFVDVFAPLLAQIDALRKGGSYPFYSALQGRGAPGGRGRGPAPAVLTANDYLGLSSDQRVRDAACEAIERFGTSRCASPLAGGYTDLHAELESHLARFFQQEACVLFASGYQANVGIISSLMQKGDLILTDLYNHASIADGARLSGADVRFFQHNSAKHLERLLDAETSGRRVVVIVEGIYSADGDIVRLPELVDVARKHGALVMIDEAHSFGVLGAAGRGAAEHFGLLDEVDLVMGTMSKSLASVGGFVVGDRQLVDVVAHNARSLIFSAALPPANVAAALAALRILEAEPELRKRLWRNARFFLDGLKSLGFDTMASETPVIPVLVGNADRAIDFTARLREKGVLVCPAIPPMVQAHLSRIRGHVTAAHDEAILGRALETIEEVGRSVGILEPVRGSQRRAATRAHAGGAGR